MPRLFFVLSVILVSTFCATLPSSTMPSGQRLHRSKCGACHPRPSIDRFDRAGWEKTMLRHRTRVRMDEARWQELLDYLATGRAPDRAAPDGHDASP